MAAPTSVRVWAIASTSTFLKWTYAGSNSVAIFRSTDGVSYSSIAVVSSSTSSYNDTALTAGTKYWYKLTDDDSATFSSVVTVTTHACEDNNPKRRKGFTLPRFRQRQLSQSAKSHNKAMRDLEDLVDKRISQQDDCIACVVDGAVVIDCAQDCECWDVDVDADINSITFLHCNGIDPCIHFRVPPNTTRGICGFPQGHGGFATQFTGDECFTNPISGGTNGRTMTTGSKPPRSKPGSGKGGSGGGAAGGSSCECIPSNSGALTVKCCSDDCSMDCGSSKSLQIKICGGAGPYSISGSAGLTFKKQGGATVSSGIKAGETVIIAPPANSGSGEAGTAYTSVKSYCYCFSSSPNCGPGCGPLNAVLYTDYGCNDQVLANNNADDVGNPTGCGAGFAGTFFPGPCSNNSGCSGGANAGQPTWGSAAAAGTSGLPVSGGVTCDKRTAPMIAAGCNPCGASAGNKTFTVTDAAGVSVVTTITS